MNLYYIQFSETLKKDALLEWAIIADSEVSALSKAEAIGKNPVVVRGPYKLSKDWE